MSNNTTYVTEPATHGKVVLHTSVGPLDVELWSKEAPKAVRNFVQLGLEGYYDGVIFHRVIKEFMAQTGDPTGTGTGGESVYGGTFKDEFHGRLRFTHRGLLGMASSGPDTNGSQFFVTLDRCEWLDRKHTIFGRVTGNSLYNLPRFNEIEVDEHDRPAYPPRIERFEVLLEPFDDIVPRAKAAPADEAADGAPKKKKKKEKKNFSLLSFGEEAQAEEAEIVQMGERAVVSSHDALDDPRLSREQAIGQSEIDDKSGGGGTDARAEYARLREEMAAEARASAAQVETGPQGKGWKWRGKGTSHDDDDDDDDDEEEEGMAGLSTLERQRAKYVKKSRESAGLSKKQRQDATLAKLNMFKQTLHKPAAAPAAAADDDDTEGWQTHQLKFKVATMAESAQTYDSFDPLKHGEDDKRAVTKIKERERTLLSMRNGTHEDDYE